MPNFVAVADASEIPTGSGTYFLVEGTEVAIFNVNGTFYAIDNVCRHAGGPLGDGYLEGEVVTCPLHGWQYDVTTGKVTLNPDISVPTYQVKVENGKVMVAVS